MSRQFWLKFAHSFFFLLVLIGLMQMSTVLSRWQFQLVGDWNKILIALAGIIALSLLIAWVWHRSKKGQHWYPVIQDIISFYVAYQITLYGAAKILKTQLQVPDYVLDQPIGSLNGFWLTWAYFGHSPAMATILGYTQVIGSILLLFRRTRLIGVIVLLPVMINIDLINQFYAISPLAYYNSLHYTAILFFLLFLDFDKLKAAFLSYREIENPLWKKLLLNLVRVLVIAGAFFFIANMKSGIGEKTKVNGKWQVASTVRNGKEWPFNPQADSLWSTVYFEWRYGCLFKYHPDRFQDKDLSGQFKVDEKSRKIAVNFYPADEKTPADSASFDYRFVSDSVLVLEGIYRKDSLTLNLNRLK